MLGLRVTGGELILTAWGPGQPDNNNHDGVVENHGCLWNVDGYKWNNVGYYATLGTICQIA